MNSPWNFHCWKNTILQIMFFSSGYSQTDKIKKAITQCLVHILQINYINGLAQDCSNSIAYMLELWQSCSKPSIYSSNTKLIHIRVYPIKYSHHFVVLCFVVIEPRYASELMWFISPYSSGHSGITQMSRHLKSPVTLLFVKQLVRVRNKRNIKAPPCCPFWRESTGARWIPNIKGQ